MSAARLARLIGLRAWFRVDGLSFPVIIQDVKESWGRTLVEVSPPEGKGLVWKELGVTVHLD